MVSFDVNILPLMLATLTVLLCYWLWTNSRRPYTKFKIPPYPVRPLPFFGHFFHLLGNLRGKLKKWRRLGGEIYSMDTAGQLHILVNNFKDIKEIWVKHADAIVNLQPNFGDVLLNEYDTGITAARDDNWKEQRSISLSILRNFGMGKNLMAGKIEIEVTAVVEKLASLNEQPEDVLVIFNLAVANIISSVAAGKRFDYGDPYFMELLEPLCDFVGLFPRVMLVSALKPLFFLPGDMFKVKKWVNSSRKVNEIYSKYYIEKFKQEFNENEEPQNFISAYLKEMKILKDKGIHTKLDEANLVALVRTFFAAGTDTTSTTMVWCFLFILYNPEVQEKVYKEIETVVGTERRPNMNDKPKLIYLNAVIMETQRRSSLVPIGFKREVSQTFEYGGFTFPKGCVIWPILDSVLYDKKIWGDPENFRPERFIDKNGALINREELIPFSIGRRICPGEALAKMELFLFLSAIFQRFRFEPADKSKALPSLKELFGMVVVPQPFKLRFIERKH